MRRFVALTTVVGLANVVLAAPPPPGVVRAYPVYSTPPAIKVRWIEAGGATFYSLFRGVDGGIKTEIAQPPVGAINHLATLLDLDVDASHTYEYRLEACDAAGCVSAGTRTSAKVVWPIEGGREVLNGFNEVVGWNGVGENGSGGFGATGYHDGVDLQRTTANPAPGDHVLAPRGGLVSIIDLNLGQADNGFIQVQVDVGGGVHEYDLFNHIANAAPNLPLVAVGDAVAPGDRIARIGTQRFPGTFNHVHFQIARDGSPRINIRHGLMIFTDPADRDPKGKLPALFDENKDGKTEIYRDHATGSTITYDAVTRPLHDDVDVEVEVMDEQGTNPRQAPIDLGYWIQGPLPPEETPLDDVKSSAHPYRLYDFRTDYYGLGVPTPCSLLADTSDLTNAGCVGVPAADCRINPGLVGAACLSVIRESTTAADGTITETQFLWPMLHHFVITHAGGETGARNTVSSGQFWRTAAKDDGMPVGSTHANYAGQPITNKGTNARFPDGDYTIHVIASDLVHPNVDLPIRVRLENFAPYVKEILVVQDAAPAPGTGIASVRQIYRYKYRQGGPYPGPELGLARTAGLVVPGGARLIVVLRFSEPMASVKVDLVRDRGAGSVLGAVSGTLAHGNQDNDTWTGQIDLPTDPSGNSDALAGSDERDVAVRVIANDRGNGTLSRPLDVDGAGGGAAGDLNHLIRLDLSPPKKTIDVEKP